MQLKKGCIMKDKRTKITPKKVEQMKILYDAGTKQKHIASTFGVSLSTIQSVKRHNFNYDEYRKFTLNQFKEWDNRKIETRINTTVENRIDKKKITNDVRWEFLMEKIAQIEAKLNYLLGNSFNE